MYTYIYICVYQYIYTCAHTCTNMHIPTQTSHYRTRADTLSALSSTPPPTPPPPSTLPLYLLPEVLPPPLHVTHIWICHVSCIWIRYVTRMNESYHAYKNAVAHIWMRHVAHIWMRHVAHIWMRGVAHIWMRRIHGVNAWWHTGCYERLLGRYGLRCLPLTGAAGAAISGYTYV